MFDFLIGVVLGKASEDYIEKIKQDSSENERNRDDYDNHDYEYHRRNQVERHSEAEM